MFGGMSLPGLIYSYNGTTTTASSYELYLVTYGSFFESYQFEISYTVPAGGPDTLYFFSSSSSVTGGTFAVSDGAVTPTPTPIPTPEPVDPDAIVINENELGAAVGTLITTDEDVNDTHTYSLGGADADLFEIEEGVLKLKDGVSTNYEDKSSLVITISTLDSNGSSFVQSMEIIINDVNEQPTDIALSSTEVNESFEGAIIGNVQTIDEDTNDTYVYTFSGADAD